jgi:hypothetical protein
VGEGSAATVSDGARIEEVSLRVPDSASAAHVEARVRQALGDPVIECFVASMHDVTIWRRQFWRGARGRGVVLLTAAGATGRPASPSFPLVTRGTGGLSLGGPRPPKVETRACP